MKEFMAWAFLIGSCIASYKNDHDLAMFFILLGCIYFVHVDVDKIKKGMNL